MTSGYVRLRGGGMAWLETRAKSRMTVFTTFGHVSGHGPCHWTAEGSYRMDGREHEMDIVGEG